MNTVDFKNKTVLITGASSGLGKKLAIDLSSKGANLILAGRDKLALNNTASQCQHASHVVQADVTSEEDCCHLIMEAIKRFKQIDYLILNAGISMYSRFDSLQDLAIIHQMMDTNYFGVINCVHHALPHLKKNKGMIVVISSAQGKFAVPYHSGYAASKHALQGFFDTVRMELKKDEIDILMILPGWIRGTSLKQNALKNSLMADNDSYLSTRKAHNYFSTSIENCSKKIINAIIKRKQEMFVPKIFKPMLFIKLFCSKWLDERIRKTIK